MNKGELIDAIAGETGMNKAESERALDATLKTIYDGAKSDPVQLVGFGTFKNVKVKARKGRNPQTGAAIDIPARIAFKFKASKNPKY